MNIYVANDHAGYELKKNIIPILKHYGHVIDLGADSAESSDYPLYAQKLATHMDASSKGVLICGSGVGMCIAANRFSHIRAAVCHSKEETRLARQHDDINVLCLAGRLDDSFIEMIDMFFKTPFFKDERYKRRIDFMS